MTLKLKYMDPSKLVAHARNSRTHSPGQVAKIVAALREFGFINPVIVAGTTIIAGHARVEAVLQVPEIKTVPTLDVSHLTEAQQRAYIIADNRLSEDAGWNDAILREELGFLKGLDFSVSLTGFDDSELKKLGAADAFKPVLDPGKASSTISAGEVAGAAERLEGQYANAGQQDLVTITCPHCGEDFQVQKGAV